MYTAAREIQIRYKEKIVHGKGHQKLEQVALKDWGIFTWKYPEQVDKVQSSPRIFKSGPALDRQLDQINSRWYRNGME